MIFMYFSILDMAPKLAILRKCIHTSCPCYFLITWWFHRDIGMFSLFFSLCCDRRNSRNQLYIYAECEELGSTILSKIPTSEKCRIAKIAIWYYRGGSCSSVYWDLGINRKMGLGNPQQDENLMREYCDERQYC